MIKPNKTNIPVSSDGSLKPLPQEPTTTCNARQRHGTGYCLKPAGAGTDHEGTGRCKDHGGKNSGRPARYFSATELLGTEKKELLSKLESVLSTSPSTISNLDNEITILRSIFYEYLQKCKTEDKLPNPDDLKKFTDSLAKLVDLKGKLEKSDNAGPKTVRASIFLSYVNQINEILRKHIEDPYLLNQIGEDLEKLQIPADES